MSQALRPVESNTTSPTNILVVEDDARVRRQISEYLRLRGFMVFEVGTGDEALSFLDRDIGRVDCIFSDVQMPGRCDGVGLARWVLANRPGLPILLTSGEYRSEDLDPMLSPKLRVLPKPYRGHAVEEALAAQTEQFRLESDGRVIHKGRAKASASSAPMLSKAGLGLPLYGVEQLAACGLLEWESDPAMLVIRDWLWLKKSSLAAFYSRLSSVTCATEAPSEAIPLRQASRRIGGREKPWGAIFSAICTGDLTAWRDGPNLNARHLLVRPSDLARFDNVAFRHGSSSFPFSTLITKDDCAELLNISPRDMRAVVSDYELAFSEIGRARRTEKSTIIEIARRVASAVEIGSHLGVTGNKAAAIMKQRGVSKISVGWDRAQLSAMGVLPQTIEHGDDVDTCDHREQPVARHGIDVGRECHPGDCARSA